MIHYESTMHFAWLGSLQTTRYSYAFGAKTNAAQVLKL